MKTIDKNAFINSQEDFFSRYKGKTSFARESKYYRFFLDSLDDRDLYDKIIFCNDVLQLPPIYVFVRYRKDLFTEKMSANEKRGLGACFGYLFQYMLGYKEAKSVWVGEKITDIKNASYFIKE